MTTTAARPRPHLTPDGLGALTRRASLNAAGALLDYAARIGTSLVVTPILVSGLGRSLFGVWEMLGRFTSYVNIADGRPTEALRLVMAQRMGETDATPKRRLVGAALVVWVLLLPLVLAVGATLAWLAPSLTHTPPAQAHVIRVACAFLVGSFLVGTLAAVPESVLRGMNLGYRRMGLQAALDVVGGLLSAGAVLGGMGLVGLGAAQVIRGVLTGLFFWVLVRHLVHWFAAARPRREDVRALLGMSAWLSVGELIAKLLLASDVLVLGAIVSPAAVTTYALTSYAARTALGIHVFAANGAVPGLGGLIGRRELPRAAQARVELQLLTWLFVTAIGVTILAWNRTFLALWVGPGSFAGPAIDALVVLMTVQTMFIRNDAYIIDAALRPRQRVLIAAAAAVCSLGLAIAGTRLAGVAGLCVGLIIGRGVQSVAYPVIVRQCLGRAGTTNTPVHPLRLAAISTLLFGAAAALAPAIRAAHWLLWAPGVAATLAATGALALLAAPARTRDLLRRRLRWMTTSLRPRRR